MNHIIIEGFMGSGKSTVGKALARELQLPLINIDKRVSTKLKMKPAEIYDHYGEVYYRAMETCILADLLELHERSVVLLGSGLATMPQNEAYLKKLGKVYYLKAGKPVILERLRKGDKSSWLKSGDLTERVDKMLSEREPAYKKVADVIIATDGKTTEEIVQEILEADKAFQKG